jgi:hypothetical protein
MQPNVLAVGWGGGGGVTIWAMGTPRFVTKTGSPVLRTRSTTARQVALSLETEVVLIGDTVIRVHDHGQNDPLVDKRAAGDGHA